MTPDKATALREAAERATPGPWQKIHDAEHPANRRITSDHRPHIAKVYGTHMGDEADGEANAAYIALADPPTILSLLAERERLRGALESIRDIAGAPSDRDPDYSRLDRIDATARQALEATDDQR